LGGFADPKNSSRPTSVPEGRAQGAAAFSKKWLRHFFDSLTGPGGAGPVFCAPRRREKFYTQIHEKYERNIDN